MEHAGIQIEFLFVLPGTLRQDLLERDTKSFIEVRREGLIVGIASVGLENGESIERFGGAFLRFREAGLGVEVHAAEHSGPESVWDALNNGFPDQLGHAISAFPKACGGHPPGILPDKQSSHRSSDEPE